MSTLFIALIILVVIIVIIITKDRILAWATIGALVAFIIYKEKDDGRTAQDASRGAPHDTPQDNSPDASLALDKESITLTPNLMATPSLYGTDFNEWDLMKQAPNIGKVPEIMASCGTNSIDDMNAIISVRRARDKAAIDGSVSKNANYYRYHFAGELNESERKPWWGNSES
jgi:hypothetical protein